eukprot:gene16926-5214_t
MVNPYTGILRKDAAAKDKKHYVKNNQPWKKSAVRYKDNEKATNDWMKNTKKKREEAPEWHFQELDKQMKSVYRKTNEMVRDQMSRKTKRNNDWTEFQ